MGREKYLFCCCRVSSLTLNKTIKLPTQHCGKDTKGAEIPTLRNVLTAANYVRQIYRVVS